MKYKLKKARISKYNNTVEIPVNSRIVGYEFMEDHMVIFYLVEETLDWKPKNSVMIKIGETKKQ